MNIQKALSFIAFGFLFTLLNVNINTVNITPAFIGWALLYLSYDYLGNYVSGKSYLKLSALVLTILSLIVWIIGLVTPDYQSVTGILNSVISVISAAYLYILIGVLEVVADDYGSDQSRKLHRLKLISLVAVIFTEVLAIVMSNSPSAGTAIILAVSMVVALVVAIIMMFTLFRLRKDVSQAS